MKNFIKKIKCIAFILLCLGSSVDTQAQWTQRGNDIGGEAAGDQSGYSVSLSSDGNTLAIGAPDNNGTDTNAGQVRVYTWNGTAWTQRGNDIDGEAAGDFSGQSVSLSSDGNTLAIGAIFNDGTGPEAGQVRIYEFPDPEINLRQGNTAIASGDSYDFGEVDTNTSSAEVDFTLENTGDADLVLSGAAGSLVALSGTDADQFSVSQIEVTSPLAAGSDQPFTVTFSPTSEGEKAATLTITSNDADEGTYTLNLSGTGIEIITSLLSTEKESMMIYPNPTRDRVIAKNLPLGKNIFVLTDVLGNTILAGETSNTLELDMSGLTAGTYTLTVTTGEQVFSKKILKY